MLWLFAITIFSSAALLFLVQPMVGKMVLPLAGGSSAVWNTCMVFFQAALLGGYLYSHVVTKKLTMKWQVIVHALVALCAFALLPMQVPKDWVPPSGTMSLTLWMIGLLGVAVGLPFFVVSTTGPLVQSWFSKTDHPTAKDPYFLYGASNIGSAIGLLGYPLLVEPNGTLGGQSLLWAGLFAMLAVLLIACGVASMKSQARQEEESPRHRETLAPTSPSIAWRRRGFWTLLAAVPSSLMIGVTQHISTDVASVPLLWVVPLFLYLITFTLAFSPNLPVRSWVIGWGVAALAIVDAWIVMTGRHGPILVVGGVHVLSFFMAALMCHRRLADDRPSPDRLTEFYFFIALGGVIGGIFNALVAPVVFTHLYEYPIAIAAACLLRPWGSKSAEVPTNLLSEWRARLHGWLTPARAWVGAVVVVTALWCAMLGMDVITRGASAIEVIHWRTAPTLGLLVLVLVFFRHPAFFGTGLLVLMITGQGLTTYENRRTLAVRRSFFGINHVYAFDPTIKSQDGQGDVVKGDAPVAYWLLHGTTTHGAQLRGMQKRLRPDGTTFDFDPAGEPRTYFHRRGPVGEIFKAIRNSHPFYATMRGEELAGIGGLVQGSVLARGLSPLPIDLSASSLAGMGTLSQIAAAEREGAGPLAHVAIIGLGTGSMVAYAERGQTFDVYEIDPAVVEIAATPEYFTFLRDARARGATVNVIVGDGRLRIANAKDGTYGLVFIDAFSSDSIPVHLLTIEAVKLLLDKARPDGVVAFHISNRHFELAPVLARAAREFGVYAWQREQFEGENDPRSVSKQDADKELARDSSWVVLARSPANVPALVRDSTYWVPLRAQEHWPLWTDDFSNILSVFRGWNN
jgi:hypothetical protein